MRTRLVAFDFTTRMPGGSERLDGQFHILLGAPVFQIRGNRRHTPRTGQRLVGLKPSNLHLRRPDLGPGREARDGHVIQCRRCAIQRLEPDDDRGACRQLPRNETLSAANPELDAAERFAIGIQDFRVQLRAFAPLVGDIEGEHHVGGLGQRSDVLFEEAKLRHVASRLLAIHASVDGVGRDYRRCLPAGGNPLMPPRLAVWLESGQVAEVAVHDPKARRVQRAQRGEHQGGNDQEVGFHIVPSGQRRSNGESGGSSRYFTESSRQ